MKKKLLKIGCFLLDETHVTPQYYGQDLRFNIQIRVYHYILKMTAVTGSNKYQSTGPCQQQRTEYTLPRHHSSRAYTRLHITPQIIVHRC